MSQLSFDFDAAEVIATPSQAEKKLFLSFEEEIHIANYLADNFYHKERIYSSNEVSQHYLEQAICIAAYSEDSLIINEPDTGKDIILLNDESYVILDEAASELLNKHLVRAKIQADKKAKFDSAKAEALANNQPFKASAIELAEDMNGLVKANIDGLHFDELKGLVYSTFKSRAEAINMPEKTYRAVVGYILGLNEGSFKLPYRSDKSPVPLPK